MNRMSISQKKQLTIKIFCACLLIFISLLLPSFVLQHFPIFENSNYNHFTKSLVIGILVITGTVILRRKLDKGTPKEIGLNQIKTALKNFSTGIGLILVPVIIALTAGWIFGLAEFKFNIKGNIGIVFILGFISTLFTDALSEELIFRGYVYSNLKAHFSVWKSSLIAIAIFLLAPVVLITVQNNFNIQGAVPLTGGYIVTMILFGIFMQYLRVIFKSIWVGVGFHLVFVHMNQLMGITSNNLVQFSEDSNQPAMQGILIGLLLITFISLIIYPIIQRRKRNKIKFRLL
mgnify:CR=1 FL=1